MQFATILLPIIAVVAYQTLSEARRTKNTEKLFQLHEQSLAAKERFTVFMNGVVDAVDTQRLGSRALAALRNAEAQIRTLAAATGSSKLASLSGELGVLSDAFTKDGSIQLLEALRGKISNARALIAETEETYASKLDEDIRLSIEESQRVRRLVATVSGVLVCLTLWFIYQMIRGLTDPLAAAVQVADAVADGRPLDNIKIERGRDIGNLLGSLQRMHKSLNEYRARVAEYQIGLENTIDELADSRASLAQAQRLAQLGNWHWEVGSAAPYWSEEMFRVLDADPAHPPSLRHFLRRIDAAARKSAIAEFRSLLTTAHSSAREHQVIVRNANVRAVCHQFTSEADSEGRITRLFGVVQDVSERKRIEEEIRRLGLYDGLTGLPNRRFFRESLEKALARARRTNESVAVMFLDLDRFKRINDTLGHRVGDSLLRDAAKRLQDCIRDADYAARNEDSESLLSRLGGDEFTIALVGLRHPEDAGKVATRILAEMARPFVVEQNELSVSASIGVAVYPHNGETVDELLKHADTAMYNAKDQGKNAYRFFTETMNATAREKLAMENELRRALSKGEFVVHYQPKVDTRSGSITGVEALIRWNHPERGLIPPGTFIPVAEDAGLIIPIGQWVLRAACRQLKDWSDAGLNEISIAVNMSSPHFQRGKLMDEVAEATSSFTLSPGKLEIEVTESIFMDDSHTTQRTLRGLRAHGVRIAIDDFGTGYSSLSYLRRLSVDILKIDRSFVADLTTDPKAAAIATAIVSLGRSLKLDVVAEGVETAEQVAVLRESGCHLMQGYYFCKPMPAVKIEAMLRTAGENTVLPG